MVARKGSVKRVCLAYSGGLDTSVILRWLIEEYACEVVAFCADVGQEEELAGLPDKAKATGAIDCVVRDVREEFVRDFVFPALRGNAVYEGHYLLGTSLARPIIAKHQVAVARELGCDAVAHGATGKGNDQVRFELTYRALAPELAIIAPWREWDSALAHGLHRLRPEVRHPGDRHREEALLDGPQPAPHLLRGRHPRGPLARARRGHVPLDEVARGRARRAGRGRDPLRARHARRPRRRRAAAGGAPQAPEPDRAASTAWAASIWWRTASSGIKSRGVYETPGGTVLHLAHRAVESITMDREVMHERDRLIPRFAELIYYGFWYSPELDFLRAAIEKSQENVTGEARVRLFKGAARITGRRSPVSLYSEALSTFEDAGKADTYVQADATGFIRLQALRLPRR